MDQDNNNIIIIQHLYSALKSCKGYGGAGGFRLSLSDGMEVGLGPGDIVLDGDPAPPPPKGAQQCHHFLAH